MTTQTLEGELNVRILLSAPCGSRRYGIHNDQSDYDRMVITAEPCPQRGYRSLELEGNRTDLYVYDPIYLTRPERYGDPLLLAGLPVADCGAPAVLEYVRGHLSKLLDANLPYTYQRACYRIAHSMQFRLPATQTAVRTARVMEHCFRASTLCGAFDLTEAEKSELEAIRWGRKAETGLLEQLKFLHTPAVREWFLNQWVDTETLKKLSEIAVRAGKENDHV